MAAVEPSELEMDTTMKAHRCNLTIAASDLEMGLSPSPWGLWTQDNSLGTFTDPRRGPECHWTLAGLVIFALVFSSWYYSSKASTDAADF